MTWSESGLFVATTASDGSDSTPSSKATQASTYVLLQDVQLSKDDLCEKACIGVSNGGCRMFAQCNAVA